MQEKLRFVGHFFGETCAYLCRRCRVNSSHMFGWLRNLFGRTAGEQSTDDPLPGDGESTRESKRRKWLQIPKLRDPRIAEVLANLEELQEEHRRCELRLAEDIARIAAGVEAMPQVRQQVEDFVRTVGGALGNAAARLEEADARMTNMEHSARTQTEIIAMMRTELDRQGRSIRDIADQSAALLASMERFAASRASIESATQYAAGSASRGLGSRDLIVYGAACIAVAAALFTIFR